MMLPPSSLLSRELLDAVLAQFAYAKVCHMTESLSVDILWCIIEKSDVPKLYVQKIFLRFYLIVQ